MRSTLILAVVAVVALSGVVVAQNQADLTSGDFVFSEFNDPAQASQARREVNAVVESNRVYINLLNATEEQENWLRVDFSNKNFPRIRLSRFDFVPVGNNASANDSANATTNAIVCDPNSNATFPCNLTNNSTEGFSGFTFRVGFLRLIEFEPEQSSNETNASESSGGCYANQTIVSELSLIGKNWTDMSEEQLSIDANNDTANVTEYCTSMTENYTSVAICMRIANVPVVDDTNHSIGPNRVKISLNITNYNFVGNNTKLALAGFAASNITANKSDEEPRLILFNEEGAFDWDGFLKTEKGPMNVESSDLLPLSELLSGEISDQEGLDDPLGFPEVESGIVFCVDNDTRAMRYSWDSSAEINAHLSNENATNV